MKKSKRKNKDRRLGYLGFVGFFGIIGLIGVIMGNWWTAPYILFFAFFYWFKYLKKK